MADVLSNREYREFAIAFAAGAAMLLASLANFLTHNSYPYLRPEIGLIVAALLAFAALMAAWYIPQRQWGRSFLEGLLASIFVDLNTDIGWLIFAAGLGVAALTFWRRVSLLGPMAVLGSVIFLTTIAGIGGRPDWIKTVKGDAPGGSAEAAGKPAIIHIILDEHLGLEGMAAEGPEGEQLRDELQDFYTQAGFASYGGAYSQHYHSANSIPYALNYGTRLGESVDRRGVTAGPTEHLGYLVEQGYRLTILQSDYADFCTGARFQECITYDSSSLRPTLAVPMSTTERTELIVSKALNLTELGSAAGGLWNMAIYRLRRWKLPLLRFDLTLGGSSSVGAMETLPILIRHLASARLGEAYFAHLLLPHHPYALAGNCDYVPRPWHGMKTAAAITVRRSAYYQQVRCTKKLVKRMLDALTESAAANNTVVIIHGDHGSRLARYELYDGNKDKFSDADLLAGYSTAFAVKAPSIQPAYFVRPQPVDRLLRDFAASQFMTAPPTDGPIESVVLVDWELKPRSSLPLPSSWLDRLDRPMKGQ